MTQTLSGRLLDDSSDELEDIEAAENEAEFYQCLYIARSCALFAVLLHFGNHNTQLIQPSQKVFKFLPLSAFLQCSCPCHLCIVIMRSGSAILCGITYGRPRAWCCCCCTASSVDCKCCWMSRWSSYCHSSGCPFLCYLAAAC